MCQQNNINIKQQKVQQNKLISKKKINTLIQKFICNI